LICKSKDTIITVEAIQTFHNTGNIEYEITSN
jgi:hypothetical protein